ncbi:MULTISPECIES: pilus assembly protein PilP [unclassified Lonepinella]|uniref:pilus assembly protein PilP n=1 Tax=unclassified Lonepinella TaxID=2642006 RepID=UPI0036DA08C2
MLTKILSLIILLCCSFAIAQQNDPFDKNQRGQSTESANNLPKIKITKCSEKQANIMPNSSFDQLKIVGILLSKDKKQILLQNNEGEIDSAKENDLVGMESYSLQHITKTDAEFLTWQADCSAGNIINVKL